MRISPPAPFGYGVQSSHLGLRSSCGYFSVIGWTPEICYQEDTIILTQAWHVFFVILMLRKPWIAFFCAALSAKHAGKMFKLSSRITPLALMLFLESERSSITLCSLKCSLLQPGISEKSETNLSLKDRELVFKTGLWSLDQTCFCLALVCLDPCIIVTRYW